VTMTDLCPLGASQGSHTYGKTAIKYMMYF